MRKIVINDIIWGKIVIREPVAVEIIKSPFFRRLKGIDQAGYLPLYNNPRNLPRRLLKHTRLEHSIGVYWLLKTKGDSLEAQISGLVHDASHAAFSHTADYIFARGCQKFHSYQDDNHEAYLKQTTLPKILKKYGLSFLRIAREANFPLLENNLPDICADRIDYALRTALHFQDITGKEAREIIDHLRCQKGEWYFDNLVIREKFARLFKYLNDYYLSNKGVAIMFFALKNFFKYAVKLNYLNEQDFVFGTDEKVFRKVKKFFGRDKQLAKFYNALQSQDNFLVSARKIKGAERVYCKSRIIDPLVIDNGKIKRLSEIKKGWGKIVKDDLKPNKFYVKIKEK